VGPSVRSFDTRVDTNNLLLFLVKPVAIDLSRATKLRDMVLRPSALGVGWITTALQTTILKHRELRKILIYISHYWTSNAKLIKRSADDCGQWVDLDRLLVQFCESRSTRPKVVIRATLEGEEGEERVRSLAECLLPELTRKGMIDLAE